ncbi:MAG TPA: arginase family protein [Candidatus Peribacteraceae bacterium]|nr:arginase family protein [Candidatus Peribacteraceae bacterium]
MDTTPYNSIDPKTKHTDVWRLLQRSLEGQGVTVVRSPHDFSKKTPGAAEGVGYLLDDRGLLQRIEQTRARIRDVTVTIDQNIMNETKNIPELRHGRETIALAKSGAAVLEDAARRGDKVVVIRGAHDAADTSGLLKFYEGKLGYIKCDVHADEHNEETSVSKSEHGMWGAMVRKRCKWLNEVMENITPAEAKNMIYIGVGQPEPAEEKVLEELASMGAKIFTGHNMNMEEIYKAQDELQSRVPIAFEVDNDGMIDSAASMPGGEIYEREIKHIATRIGSNQYAVGMKPVVHIAISEFSKPNQTASPVEIAKAEKQAEIMKNVVLRALGAGFAEDAQDLGIRLERGNHASSPPESVSIATSASVKRTGSITRKRLLCWAGGIAATIGGFIAGHQIATNQQSTKNAPTATAKLDKETKSKLDELYAHHLEQKQGAVLNQFSRSAFMETAAQLRAAVESDNQVEAEAAVKTMTRIYMISRNDAPDKATVSYLDQLALSEFMMGFGLASKDVNPKTYYQQFLQEKKQQVNDLA